MNKGLVKSLFFSLTTFALLLISFPASADPLDNWHWRNPLPSEGKMLLNIAYGNNTFISVGWSGTIITSPDGINWTKRNSETREDLKGITYGNNTFISVGMSGTIITSPVGITWTKRNSGTSNSLDSITYGNNTFVVVGEKSAILTSSDGINWTKRSSGDNRHLYAIAYGNNTFVAVGEGTIITSPDGINWVIQKFGATYVSIAPYSTERTFSYDLLLGITYCNKTFVAVGEDFTIITSQLTEGPWLQRHSGTPGRLCGIIYGKNTFVAVGDSGDILQSDPVSIP